MAYKKEIDFTIGGWTFKRFAKNFFKIYRTVSPNTITMTGAAVETQLSIPFPHRWNHVHFYHTTSAYVASSAVLDIIIKRTVGLVTPAKFEEYLFHEEKILDSKITEMFGEGFEYERGVWVVSLTSTATDLIFPIFYVQKLGDS